MSMAHKITESPSKHGKVIVQSKSVDSLSRVKLPKSTQKLPKVAQLSSLPSFDSFEECDYIEYVRKQLISEFILCILHHYAFEM